MAVQDGVGPEPALGVGDAVLVEPPRDRARAGRGSPDPAPRRPRYRRRPGARPQAAPGRRGGEPRSRPRPPRRGRRRRSSSLAFGVLAADVELALDGGRPLLVGRVAGVERTRVMISGLLSFVGLPGRRIVAGDFRPGEPLARDLPAEQPGEAHHHVLDPRFRAGVVVRGGPRICPGSRPFPSRRIASAFPVSVTLEGRFDLAIGRSGDFLHESKLLHLTEIAMRRLWHDRRNFTIIAFPRNRPASPRSRRARSAQRPPRSGGPPSPPSRRCGARARDTRSRKPDGRGSAPDGPRPR